MGAYTRVAERLGISRQFVSQVARSERKSGRVVAELVREMKRPDRKKADISPEPATPSR